MKTAKILVFLITISLILSACTRPTTDSTEKIIPPQNQLMLIKGTWQISEVLMITSSSEKENETEWLDTIVQFSNEYMSLGESILEKPQYQMKRVSAEQYLLFNSKSLPEDFEFHSKEVEVITVIDQDKFFCEVLIINEDELVLKIQGNSFYLVRLDSEVNEHIASGIDNDSSQEINILTDKSGLIRTGVLIGLRSPNMSGGDELSGTHNYRTVWISSTNTEVNSIFEMENIFFPRRSGFWKIEVKRDVDGSRSEEYVVANNILMEDNRIEMQLKNKVLLSQGLVEGLSIENNRSEMDFSRWKEKIGEVTRKIDYVGNDYISVESSGSGLYSEENRSWRKSKLQLLPIDGLPSGSGVKISDILNEDGVIAMKSAWERAIRYLEVDSPDVLYREELLENFGIERKLGHWLLKGRINYIKDKEFNVADYSISLIPPPKVVFYDTLVVPWTNIKDRVPRALDAYTSPNKDIAIVITKRDLLIYDIYGNDLGPYPRERIDIKEGETIIMAEWATGQYVDSWESMFQKSGGVSLEY